MNDSTKVAGWFKAIAILAIIWNIMGVFAYLAQAFMTPEMISTLPEEQQAMYQNIPAWATAAFALAVWGGLLGSILLFMRKPLARIVLLVSLIGIIVNDIYMFALGNVIEASGNTAIFMQAFVLIVAIYLLVVFNKAKAKGWIA